MVDPQITETPEEARAYHEARRKLFGEEIISILKEIESLDTRLKFACILYDMHLHALSDDWERTGTIGMVSEFMSLWEPIESIAVAFKIDAAAVRECEVAWRQAYVKTIEYREYLRSPHWQRRRKVALEAAEHKCQLCSSSKRLDVHHRTYAHLGNEGPTDLTVLCRRCHENFHKTGRLVRSHD